MALCQIDKNALLQTVFLTVLLTGLFVCLFVCLLFCFQCVEILIFIYYSKYNSE